ncbi:MAG: radical SAM protein [Phycisphaerales bacterium]|nr:MAG: radical SAM protein [Phycisphaerales bacterium]
MAAMAQRTVDIARDELHRRMLKIADPDDRGRSSWRHGRPRYLNRFRLLKLKFMIMQRRFPGRALNWLLYLLERGRASSVHYLPTVVPIEAVNGCNLRCPECPTGTNAPSARKKGKASLSDMKAIVDQVYQRSLQISFHHFGEPLLNDDFYAACRYAVEKGLWTVIHSNLSIQAGDLAQRLVASRLCNLVASCDGVTQEVYEQYRAGGEVELVFRNIEAIVAEKRRRGTPFPWITAQFLIFDHNWHEMQGFQQRALAAGADEVLFLPACRNGTSKSGHVGCEEVFRLAQLAWIPRETPRVCQLLWDSPIITYDGGLYPCCFSYRDEDLFVTPAEAQTGTLLGHWNAPAYRQARRFFTGKTTSRPDLPLPCKHCERTANRR